MTRPHTWPRLLLLAALAAALAPPVAATADTRPPDAYRFTAVYMTFSGGARLNHIADFTPEGPISGTIGAGFAGVPPHVAVFPGGPTYFAFPRGGYPAARVNRFTGAFTPLPEVDTARYSHFTGLTFDTTRNVLVVSTRGGEGHLLAYRPRRNDWFELADLGDQDVYSITYSAADDALYGLTRTGILKYTPEGQAAGSVPLDLDIAPADLSSFQLVATNDRLAVLSAPVPDPLNQQLKVQHAYLIDPKTGAVTPFGAVEVMPEPAAAGACLAAAAAGALRRRPRQRTDRALRP